MKHSLVIALAALSSVSVFAAELPLLPESRAPFALSAPQRQPVDLLSWTYRRDRFRPTAEQYRWTEFAAGDKSMLLSGEDHRLKGNGASGFGRIGFYAGKSSPAVLGKHHLARLFFQLPKQHFWMNIPTSNDTQLVDVEKKRLGWKRKYPCASNDFVCAYAAQPAGEGKVSLRYDLGLEAPTSEHQLQLTIAKGVKFKAVKGTSIVELEPDDPTKRITIDFGFNFGWVAPNKDGSTLVIWWPKQRRGTIKVDFHESSAPAIKAPPKEGEIDFWQTDAVHVPVKAGRNRVMNGSFEQGFKGWFYSGWMFSGWRMESVKKLNDAPQQEIVEGGKLGHKCVKYRVNGDGKCEGFRTAPMSLRAGVVHTASIWAKGMANPGKGVMTLGCSPQPVAKQNKIKTVPGDKRHSLWEALKNGGDWKRYSFRFIPDEGGVTINFSGWGDGWIWVDGLQVEEGDTATDFDDDPVYGKLVTAAPYNYLHLGDPIGAKLALTGSAGLDGTVKVTLLNYYQEKVFERKLSFKLGADGLGELPLDFEASRLGAGVFVLRTDFAAATRQWTDYQRMMVIDPLGTAHPLSHFFAHFNFFSSSSRYKIAYERMKDYGIGATSWARNSEYVTGPQAELYRGLNMINRVHIFSCTEMPKYDPKNFGWRKPGWAAYSNDTARILKTIEELSYKAGMDCYKDDVYWCFGNEEELGDPLIKAGKFDEYFQRQYACWKGLKRAFDERGMKLMYGPTHGTCSFNEGNCRTVMENYMKTAAKHNFRYDFFSVHMYWAMDGAGRLGSFADREENAQALCDLIAKYGYPDTTPIFFTESSNMLPMYIPSWLAGDWSDSYEGTIPSAAFGNREFVHAGTIARIYLMDLKRWPRLGITHTWQRWLYFDIDAQPYVWPMVVNVIGRLLPDPRYVGSARPHKDVLGYVYRPTPTATDGVMAVWSSSIDLENGVKKSPVLEMKLPSDARFFDLMGNERKAKRNADGYSLVPLTSAPIFVRSGDPAALLKALEESKGDFAADLDRKYREVRFDVPFLGDGADFSKSATLPITNRVSGSGSLKAEASIGWSKKALHLKVAVKGAKAAPRLRFSLDGLGNARKLEVAKLGPDDSSYLFTDKEIKRLKAVNTQFADGTTNAASDDEVVRDFKWSWRPEANGGVWEIEMVPRFLTPTALKAGTQFGLGLNVEAGGDVLSVAVEPGLSCDGNPLYWPLGVFQ